MLLVLLPTKKPKNKLGEGCVLAWALPFCGILTRLGSYRDLGMPKLTPVHWSRQNPSAPQNPIFVFKRNNVLHLLGSGGQDAGMSVRVRVCLCLCVTREKKQTKGIIHIACLIDTHSDGMKSYSLALACFIWSNLVTGSMISCYHRKMDQDSPLRKISNKCSK